MNTTPKDTSVITLGIDISKLTFDVALHKNGKFKHKKFKNNTAGFSALSEWLIQHTVESAVQLHACMEATGSYGEALADYLHQQGFMVSVVNPAQIKSFARSELARNKTDKLDAALIARFCTAMNPPRWEPEAPEIKVLKALVRHLHELMDVRQQERNRLETAHLELVPTIQAHIDYLTQAIDELQKKINEHINHHPDLKTKKQLLESIPGVGQATAQVILSECASIERFANAKCLASFIGVAPKITQSGSSVKGRSHLSKMGRSELRKALFLPAMVCLRYNPVIKAFGQQLLKNGKTKMQVVGAAMRKLVHIIYGVLKHQHVFNENYLQKA
jgi:transposase